MLDAVRYNRAYPTRGSINVFVNSLQPNSSVITERLQF